VTAELFYRTEDLRLEEVLGFYVETANDRAIVDRLKSRSPVILKGSRGVGKSFLLRVAEAELKSEFEGKRVLPVYITFARAGLIRQSADGFLPWMIAKISTGVRRAATAYGLSVSESSALSELIASKNGERLDEKVEADSEKFWETKGSVTGAASMPDSDTLREVIEDTCDELDVARIVLLDE